MILIPGKRCKRNKLRVWCGGWRNGCLVKSIGCLARGPGFNSQSKPGSSQLSLITVPGDPTPHTDIHAVHMKLLKLVICYSVTYMFSAEGNTLLWVWLGIVYLTAVLSPNLKTYNNFPLWQPDLSYKWCLTVGKLVTFNCENVLRNCTYLEQLVLSKNYRLTWTLYLSAERNATHSSGFPSAWPSLSPGKHEQALSKSQAYCS